LDDNVIKVLREHIELMILRYITALSLTCAVIAQASSLQVHLQRTFTHSEEAKGVAFSPDSKTLATSSVDRTVKLWRIADGKLIRTLMHPIGVTSIAFSPDGQSLVSGSYDGLVRIWRLSDGVL